MDYSDTDKHERKPKKSSKWYTDEEEDVQSPTKFRKKIKREDSPTATNGTAQNNIDYKKQVLPNWLEITDSEDEFEKPIKKKKDSPKKLKIKTEPPEVSSQESSIDLDENGTRSSPKKKKKKRKRHEERSGSTDDEVTVPNSPQQTWKEKSPQKIKKEPRLFETVEDEQYSGQDFISIKNEEAVKDRKLKKSRKQKNSVSPAKDLSNVREELFSESDNHTEDTLDCSQINSPKVKKTKKAHRKASTESQKQTSNEDSGAEQLQGGPKKSPKKFIKSEPSPPMHAKINQKEQVDKSPAGTSKRSAKKATKNATAHFSDQSDADQPSPSRPEKSPTKQGKKSSKASAEENEVRSHPDDDDISEEEGASPKLKEPKRRTTVLNVDALDIGEEYQIKTKREKACKNCSEFMKIKSKVKVRDMGTQTRESALLNQRIKAPLGQPRIKKAEPKSVEDRVVVPQQNSSDDELIDDIVKPPTLTKEQIKHLRTLEVTLQHPALPQHQLGSWAGTRGLSVEERNEFEKYAPLKKGVWGPSEDEIIVDNWNKFCERHDWSPNLVFPFVHFRFNGAFYLPKSEQRQKFVQCLAHGLPNRSLYSVIQRFRKIYGTHKSDRYTYAEDDLIWKTMHPKGDPDKSDKNKRPKPNPNGTQSRRPYVFADLGRKLNRTPYSVWRRYNVLAEKRKILKKVL